MSTDMEPVKEKRTNLPTISQPRLPYHPAIKERFGVDLTMWRALVESIHPLATSTDSVILALSYCKARNLDPFKRCVHIVPIYDKNRKCMVDTVWPGIAEYRITAFRTGHYAGKSPTVWGPDVTKTWSSGDGEVTVTFPEWAHITGHRRMAGGPTVDFPGPRVYWMETYASIKSGAPNAMWAKRPRGMIEKCAESGMLRVAFPEEFGGEYTADEVGGFSWHGRDAIDAKSEEVTPLLTHSKADDLASRLRQPQEEALPTTTPEPDQPPPAEQPEQAEWNAEDMAILCCEYESTIDDAETINAVREAIGHAKGNVLLSPEARESIVGYAAKREQTIHRGRGTRSN